MHHVVEDRGSAQDMRNYVAVAPTLGHEVVIYGSVGEDSPFDYSLKVDPQDAVVFIFEWTTQLQYGDRLDLARLVSQVPRERRVVIDCDGRYNAPISVAGDVNHMDPEASRRWLEVCDSLSDKICQPTLHPLRDNVRPFFFHGYSPGWEAPLELKRKEFSLCYVGNNWFRWQGLRRVLEAVEPIRPRLGSIGLVGNGWLAAPARRDPTVPEDAYLTDPSYLRQLGVKVLPPIRFDEVIATMGRGLINPVILRPLFDRLGLVTCRSFETPAASTIPLFAQGKDIVRQIYSQAAVELVLPEHGASDKLLDVLERPEHYAAIVREVRRHLAAAHSYEARLRELIEIVER